MLTHVRLILISKPDWMFLRLTFCTPHTRELVYEAGLSLFKVNDNIVASVVYTTQSKSLFIVGKYGKSKYFLGI